MSRISFRDFAVQLGMAKSSDTNRCDLRHNPYMEVSVGIENILKCIRVDYVWRITHRHPAYKIDRSGVRVALHFTF